MKGALAPQAMSAQHLAVVRGDDKSRVVPLVCLFQGIDDPSQLIIHVGAETQKERAQGRGGFCRSSKVGKPVDRGGSQCPVLRRAMKGCQLRSSPVVSAGGMSAGSNIVLQGPGATKGGCART